MKHLLAATILGMAAVSGANADDYDAIKATGKVVVATEAAFKPFEYVEDSKIIGFGSDLLVEVLADLGVGVEQLDLPFQGILAGLESKQYDIVATSVAITPERAATYAFTRPFAAIENVIVTPADNTTISSAADLNGLVVATQLGSSTEAVAREIDAALKAEGGAGFADLRLFQTFPDTAFSLRSGQVDALVIDNITAGEFMTTEPGIFRIAASWGDPVYLAWVVRPGNPKLLDSINATFTRLADSGALAQLQTKWVGTAMTVPAEGYLPEGAVQ